MLCFIDIIAWVRPTKKGENISWLQDQALDYIRIRDTVSE
jgi:hypothetical protein